MLYLIKLLKKIAKIVYLFLKLFPTQNKVVLISRQNSFTSIDFSLLKEEINKVNKKTKVVILNHKFVNKPYIIIHVLIEMYHLATSRGCIIDSYVIPVSTLKHKKNLIIIQLWHALGAIKKFGYAALNTKEGTTTKLAQTMNMHKNYTYVISGSQEMIPYFALCYNIEKEKILPYSMPRVDYLIKSDKNKIKEKIYLKYPSLLNKKNILYAPTFRKGKKAPVDKLIKEIDFENYNLIFKKHRLDKTELKLNEKIIIDYDFDVVDLLNISDYVITDYSAVAFEAAILERPLFFYVYDIEKYEKSRGLFIKYNSGIMPGVVLKKAPDIIKAIKEDNYDIKKIKKFKEKYISILDGSSSNKIISLLKLR